MEISSGIGSSNTQMDLQQLQEGMLLHGPSNSKSASDDTKIEKGSQQFEAILVGTWLKEAEQSFGSVPGGDDDLDAGGEQMMSLGIQSLSTSLSASGGLGIGLMISKAMHANAAKACLEA